MSDYRHCRHCGAYSDSSVCSQFCADALDLDAEQGHHEAPQELRPRIETVDEFLARLRALARMNEAMAAAQQDEETPDFL